MTAANLLEDGIELSFADGSRGLVPYSDVPEIRKRAAVSRLDLPNPYVMALETTQGERVEIPWDFARHYCDASYRPTIEAIAMRGRQTLGERIRHYRESAGLTQEALARAADGRAAFKAWCAEHHTTVLAVLTCDVARHLTSPPEIPPDRALAVIAPAWHVRTWRQLRRAFGGR